MARPRELLEFVIGAYTPETLPMARLAEYLADLAALLGEKERVHFVQLAEGSSKVVHAVEAEAFPKVRQRVLAAQTGEADPEVLRAYDGIDRRLREDNAEAELRLVGADEQERKLLYFPGANREVEPEYGPFHEQGQLYGVPIMVGGKKTLVNVNLQDGDKTYYCEATRDVALQIAPLLFHHHIRVYGIGKYFRNADGEWEMRGFRISHFDQLDERPLAETVERLRGITRKVGLDRNIIEKLVELRHGPSES